MDMAGMSADHTNDMDCCGDELEATAANAPMSDCTLDCKANCSYAVTAMLTATGDITCPIRFQSENDDPPDRLTPHTVGFTTPPPRI
jgi:hypothetical protein